MKKLLVVIGIILLTLVGCKKEENINIHNFQILYTGPNQPEIYINEESQLFQDNWIVFDGDFIRIKIKGNSDTDQLRTIVLIDGVEKYEWSCVCNNYQIHYNVK